MSPAELDIQLEELEIKLERLRALYEQYFLGIEKMEPAVVRKDVDRRIWMLRRENIRNTARRFKLQTIVSRYNTFLQYWQRICREIENGTYKRHLARAERLAHGTGLLTVAARRRAGLFRKAVGDETAGESLPPEGEAAPPASVSDAPAAAKPLPSETRERAAKRPPDDLDLELDLALFGPTRSDEHSSPAAARAPQAKPDAPPARTQPSPPGPAEGQARRGTRAATAPKKSPARPAGGETSLSDERLRELHSRLIEVKVENKERANVSLANLSKSLRKAESDLREKHGNRRIDFDVIVKKGKVVLKPIVR